MTDGSGGAYGEYAETLNPPTGKIIPDSRAESCGSSVAPATMALACRM